LTISRDSGAGAYSQGMAWPSPNPQLEGLAVPRPTVSDAGRLVTVWSRDVVIGQSNVK